MPCKALCGLKDAAAREASGAAPLLLDHGNAVVKLDGDGSVNLMASPTEMG